MMGKQFGSAGYKCPTYSRGGLFDAKSELIPFGMVVLELLTGKLQMQADGVLY
jgi:hypothetical protein